MFVLRRAAIRALASPSSSQSYCAASQSSRLLSSSGRAIRPSTLGVQRGFAGSARRAFADEKSAKEKAEEAAEDAKESVQDNVDAAKQKAQELKDTVGSYATGANASAGGYAEQAKDLASSASKSASDMIDSAKEGIQNIGVGEKVTDSDFQDTPLPQQSASAVTGAGYSADPQVASIRGHVPRGRQPQMDAEPSNNLYVGNLFFEVSEQTLRETFEKFGTVKSATIITDDNGLSKGFGYIEFETKEAAMEALQTLDGQGLEGRRMYVQHAKSRRANSRGSGAINTPSQTLFIGNLSYSMSDKDMNELFRPLKNVAEVRVAIDRRTGQPRGFAHADFHDVASAETAKAELEDKEVLGRRLKLDFAPTSRSAMRLQGKPTSSEDGSQA